MEEWSPKGVVKKNILKKIHENMQNRVLLVFREIFQNIFCTPLWACRTLSKIKDGAFCKNIWRLSPVSYFRKTFHLRCLRGFWIWKRFTVFPWNPPSWMFDRVLNTPLDQQWLKLKCFWVNSQLYQRHVQDLWYQQACV